MNELIRYGGGPREEALAADFPGLALARVIFQSKDVCRVAHEAGEAFAEVSGRFRREAERATQYPVAGDFVMIDPPAGEGHARIRALLPRRGVFARAAVGSAPQAQIVAANVDVAFLCMAFGRDYNLSRMERYLSAAWDSGAQPVVVLTKADLCEDLPRLLSEAALAAPGAEVLAVSREDESAPARLLSFLGPGVTATFLGSSGVGKSTLMNRLLGSERAATSAVGADGRGHHTTTHRELFPLPGGGVVLDTPGMRSLGLETADLSAAFADIDALAANCRFRDCAHGAEPGCAVRAALEAGEIDARRLESYQKLRREAKYDGLSGRRLEEAKLNEIFAGVGGMKKMRQYTRSLTKK